MRVKIADIKKRLNELDKSDGETIEILVDRIVPDKLDGPGIVTSLKRIVLCPDGSTTREVLIDANKTQGDKDNAE